MKEKYMLIIKHKKYRYTAKVLKLLDCNHYLIDSITVSLDITWLPSLVSKLPSYSKHGKAKFHLELVFSYNKTMVISKLSQVSTFIIA